MGNSVIFQYIYGVHNDQIKVTGISPQTFVFIKMLTTSCFEVASCQL